MRIVGKRTQMKPLIPDPIAEQIAEYMNRKRGLLLKREAPMEQKVEELAWKYRRIIWLELCEIYAEEGRFFLNEIPENEEFFQQVSIVFSQQIERRRDAERELRILKEKRPWWKIWKR